MLMNPSIALSGCDRNTRRALRRLKPARPGARKPVFRILDLFCGAGGATGAAKEAAERMGYRVEIIAINHWEVACATWKENYEKRFPGCVVMCCGVDDIRNARDLFGGKKVHAIIGGPECIEFSTAAGGKPENYQYRPTPWCMVRFTEALKPDVVLIENVKEFAKKWPPFPAMIAAFEAMGYSVSHGVFCAADYGDPTTRERLFIQCVKGRVCWPEATHTEDGAGNLFGLKPWVPAMDIIDWTKKGRWLDEMPGKKQYGGLPLSRPRRGGRCGWCLRCHPSSHRRRCRRRADRSCSSDPDRRQSAPDRSPAPRR